MIGAILGGIASAVLPKLFGKREEEQSMGSYLGNSLLGPSGYNTYQQRGLAGLAQAPFAQNILMGLGAPDPNAFMRLDPRQRAGYMRSLQEADQYAQNINERLGQMSQQRAAGLEESIGRQLSAVEGVGAQSASDINARYDAMSARQANNMAQSGFGNTTAVPGVQALVERERSNALRRNADSQALLLNNILGQRTSAMDNIAATQYGTAANLFSGGLTPRYGLANNLTATQEYNEPGLLGRLFG